jgi:acetyl esterase/lipase
MRQVSPKLKDWLDEFNKVAAELLAAGFKVTPVTGREYLANLTRDMIPDIPDVPLILDDVVPTPGYMVPIRIYHPDPQKALPVFVYYHGGGGMVGGVTVYDPIARKLALAANHIVVSVEYRLAPENPYPLGEQDAYWTAKNLWPVLAERKVNHVRELSLGGDSAGGALTAAVIGRTQFECAVDIKKAVMIYPGLDYTMSCPSMRENAEGFLLQAAKIAWYYDNYFLHAENRRLASPLFGAFSKRLPPVLMVTAEFCPLRDENLAYLEELKKVGVPYRHVHFPDMVHTFLNMERLVPEECRRVYQAVADFLQS